MATAGSREESRLVAPGHPPFVADKSIHILFGTNSESKSSSLPGTPAGSGGVPGRLRFPGKEEEIP
jgi:hypothetical protein